MITYKLVVEKFQTLASKHPKINYFGFGQTSDLAAYKLKYPYLWLIPESNFFEYSPDNKYQAIELQFTLRVCDKVSWGTNPDVEPGEESNNGLDALSDTFQILRELLNAIMMNTTGDFGDIEIVSTIALDPLLHVDTADVNGFETTITMRFKNDFKCISTITD